MENTEGGRFGICVAKQPVILKMTLYPDCFYRMTTETAETANRNTVQTKNMTLLFSAVLTILAESYNDFY